MMPGWVQEPVPISWTVALASAMFFIGVAGVLIRRNALVLFLCIELMLNSANLAFVAFARQWGDSGGQAIVLFAMTLAAAEVAIGLGVVIMMFRTTGVTDITDLKDLRG